MERYGIGEKGPVQKQIESDPYLKWINSGMRATDYTPEIAAAKRRFIEKQQGAKQQPTYRDTGNVVRTETIEDTAPSSMGTLSTSRSRQVTPDGMGGYGRGGLFSPDRVDSSTSNMVEPSSRGLSGVQAASDFFNFFAKPDSVTRDLPANEANLATDVANTYFSGELPMPKWRVKDAPSNSLGTDKLGNPIISREEFDANIEANLENLRFRNRFPEQGPPPNYRGGFEGTGEFAGIPTVAQPNVIIPSVTPIDPEQAYRQRQAQSPLRSQVLNELVAQGRVDPRQVGNPYVDRMIDMEIAKMQESAGYDTASSQRGLFDTRALGNPFNAEVNEARQRYDALNPVRSGYDIATGTAPSAPVTNYGQSAFPYIGQSGAGGEEILRAMDAMPPEPPAIVQEAPVVRSSQATLVDNAEDTKKFTDMGFSDDEWEAYKEGVTDVESRTSGEYTAQRKLKGGGKSQFLGRYQMGRDARSDAAKALGIKNPTEKEFLENPELQDKMFLEYTRSNYRALMRTSPEFRALSPEERKMVIAQAQLGAGNIKEALKSGKDFADSFGTKSTKWYKSVKKRLEALKNKGKQPEFNDSSVTP